MCCSSLPIHSSHSRRGADLSPLLALRRLVCECELNEMLCLLPIEFQRRKADHRLLINIPLVISEHVAAHTFDSLEKGVKRRKAAQLEAVMIGLDHLEEARAITRANAAQSLSV